MALLLIFLQPGPPHPPLYLLPSSTKRFYSRLRAISVHISPEIYSQANIRDPSGGFKRRVLLLLKEGVMDSLRRPTSFFHVARQWQHGLGFSQENLCTLSVMLAPEVPWRGIMTQGWVLVFSELWKWVGRRPKSQVGLDRTSSPNPGRKTLSPSGSNPQKHGLRRDTRNAQPTGRGYLPHCLSLQVFKDWI